MAPTEHFTDKDAAAARGICQGCALSSAHQFPTNQHYVKSSVAHDPGQQFVVDAFTHHSGGTSVFIYAHLSTARILSSLSGPYQVQACNRAHRSDGYLVSFTP